MSNTKPKPKQHHPNRVPFEGTLCRLDEPSDKAPGGARNHRVILPRVTAEAALESLQYMPIGFADEWDNHNSRQRCGVIARAWIDSDPQGAVVKVSGFLFVRDFPEVETMLNKPGVEIGMSYELADAHVQRFSADVWTITKCIFVGAAILLCGKAAYGRTTFNISASEADVIPEPERKGKVLRFEDAGSIRTLAACNVCKED